jgi:hypothetical protein
VVIYHDTDNTKNFVQADINSQQLGLIWIYFQWKTVIAEVGDSEARQAFCPIWRYKMDQLTCPGVVRGAQLLLALPMVLILIMAVVSHSSASKFLARLFGYSTPVIYAFFMGAGIAMWIYHPHLIGLRTPNAELCEQLAKDGLLSPMLLGGLAGLLIVIPLMVVVRRKFLEIMGDISQD